MTDSAKTAEFDQMTLSDQYYDSSTRRFYTYLLASLFYCNTAITAKTDPLNVSTRRLYIYILVSLLFLGKTAIEAKTGSLKVVSGTFMLACFVIVKESTCETKEIFFHFTLKALFVLEIIKF